MGENIQERKKGVEEKMMARFEVGHVAPAPFWPTSVQGDTAILEQAKDGSFYVAYYWTNPGKDAEIFRKNRIEARAYCSGNHVLPMFCHRGTSYYAEMVFDPTLYRNHLEERQEAYRTLEKQLFQFLLIDRGSGILHGLRVATPPPQFAEICGEAWIEGAPGFSAFYDRCCAVPQKELWARADKLGFFGDKI